MQGQQKLTPEYKGIPLKWLSLVTLVLQNSMLVLVMRYSRTLKGDQYITSTAVVMAEVIKFILSLIIYIKEESATKKVTINSVVDDVFGPNSAWKAMSVPAILYFIQNNLQYVAVTLLDAATFQVTYQLKILTTALFSVLILHRQLSKLKWVSLALLTTGIAIVQLPSGPSKAIDSTFSAQFMGLISVLVACLLSGLAGVWFEKVLKNTKSSVFLRNIQLSLFSAIPGLIVGVYMLNGQTVAEHGFFYGYNGWTWAAIFLQAVGGLIVAMVVKYADNILKGFATSISIIISSLASVFLLGFEIHLNFLVGAAIVLYATHLYSKPDEPEPAKNEYIELEVGETEEK